MRTFEYCLAFIEDELGVKLFDCQKEFLRQMYEHKPHYYQPSKGIGITMLDRAVILLAELKKENGNGNNES